MLLLRSLLIAASFLFSLASVLAAPEHRARLVQAILSEDVGEQIALVQRLIDANDPFVEQVLIAWRGGGAFILETNDTRIPFILDAQTDGDGNARAIRVAAGEPLKDAAGKPLSSAP